MLILTEQGKTAIEDLSIGDMIETVDHGLKPIRWIGSRRISAEELAANPKLRPIRISAGAPGVCVPQRDVLVSPQHRVLLRSKLVQRMFKSEEVLTAAKNLMSVPGISIAPVTEAVEYYHIMFDEHELVRADGLPAESMLAGKAAMESLTPEAREELIAIFPELSGIDAERISARPIVPGAKARKFVERSGKNTQALIS